MAVVVVRRMAEERNEKKWKRRKITEEKNVCINFNELIGFTIKPNEQNKGNVKDYRNSFRRIF